MNKFPLKYTFLLIISLLSSYTNLFSQVKFEKEWLNNPLIYLNEIENQCIYLETDTYALPTQGYCKQLFNAYASATISNKTGWKAGINNVIVKRIDIVYTKYPFHRKDWITNYNQLLAARLIELFEIDPGLNHPSIEYRLCLQTACATEEKAEKLFHGIVIQFELKDMTKKKPEQTKNQVIPAYNSGIKEFEEEYEIPSTSNSGKKTTKSKKVKLDCPDFRTKKRKVN